MGQHHSTLAKDAVLSSYTPRQHGNLDGTTHSRGSHAQRSDSTNSSQYSAMSRPDPPGGSVSLSASASFASDIQSKSVRAAIDSFIENCLVGGADTSCHSTALGTNQNSVNDVSYSTEGCKNEPHGESEENAKEKSGRDENARTDNSGNICANNNGSEGNDTKDHYSKKSPVFEKDEVKIKKETDKTGSSTNNPKQDFKFTKDVSGADLKGKESVQGTLPSLDPTGHRVNLDSKDNWCNSMEIKSETIANASFLNDSCPGAPRMTPTPGCLDESLGNNAGSENRKSKERADNSSDADGLTSVRLKTIIDRVLDNSLGSGVDLRNIPVEQHIPASQLSAADEKAAPAKQEVSNSNPSTAGGSKVEGAGTNSRKVEQLPICFMDHIEKAVERSFSSITEEEERKEKEMAEAAAQEALRESSTKTPAWNVQLSRNSTETNGSSVTGNSDSTISVQDIVDRVISQTEVISKLMTTSTSGTSHADTKTTATASGTFYPCRPQNELPSYGTHCQEIPARKEDMPKEMVVPDRKRGRPRMQSPYCDQRETVKQDQFHVGRYDDSGGRTLGSRAMTSDEYMHSMQVTMQRHPHPHLPHPGMRPYMGTGVTSATPSTPTFLHGPQGVALHPHMLPVNSSSIHMQPPVVSSSASMLTASSHHGAPACQPPPLLRVGPAEKVERHQQQLSHQQLHKYPHPPTRGCMCASCSTYLSHERETGVSRLSPSRVDGHIPHHSPHPPYVSKAPPTTSPSISPRYMQMVGSGESRLAVRDVNKVDNPAHQQHPYSNSTSMYPVTQQYVCETGKVHPALQASYGMQGNVPMSSYVEGKAAVNVRHSSEMHPPKVQDRPEQHIIRALGHPIHDKSVCGMPVHSSGDALVRGSSSRYTHAPGDPLVGESSALYPPDVSGKHLIAVHQSPRVETKPQPSEGPVLDLTLKREGSLNQLEDDRPLDLSKKLPSAPVHYQLERRQSAGARQLSGSDGRAYVDPRASNRVVGMHTAGDRVKELSEDGKMALGNQHLHNLETSLETYIQKCKQGVPPGTVPSSHNHQLPHSAIPPPPHHITSNSVAVIPSNSAMPLHSSSHPHQHSRSPHPPQHSHLQATPNQQLPGYGLNMNSSPHRSPFSGDSLLSPVGIRRPQLHPIPAPNLATTLGTTNPSCRASPFQSRSCTNPFPLSVVSTSPHSQMSTDQQIEAPSGLPRVSPTTESCSPQSVSREGAGSGGGVANPSNSESNHPSASRSVSPPGSDRRNSWDDRRRGSVSKHEPIQNIIGNHNPADILYLICRLCRQTYGSPYGFRKHFRNQHGFEPKAEHTIVQTISATKNARQLTSGSMSQDVDGHFEDSVQMYPPNALSAQSLNHSQYAVMPTSHADVGRGLPDDSPRSGSSGSPFDSHDSQQHSSNIMRGSSPHQKIRRAYSRSSIDNKTKTPVGAGSGSEDREDTKCLECPECGQTFQLNDFGSYKRHCRQHGQARGVGASNTGGVGLYPCAECQSTFPEPHLLQEHKIRHGTHSISASCHLCHLLFSSIAQVEEHLQTSHGQHATNKFSPCPPVIPSSLSSSSKLIAADCSSNLASSSASTVVCSPNSVTSTTSVSVSSDKTSSTRLTYSSATGFSQKVTTPPNMEVQRLPADHIVTSASPDSSSDNKKIPETVSISSSTQFKADRRKSEDESSNLSPKLTFTQDSPKGKNELEGKLHKSGDDDKDSGYSERCPSNESRSFSTESSLASPMDADDGLEFLYKHKKFGAHRKRGSSNDVPEPDAKHSRQEIVHCNTSVTGSVCSSSQPETREYNSGSNLDSEAVSSVAEKQNKKLDIMRKSPKPVGALGSDKSGAFATKNLPNKTEARHQMPFVWDRVTRSQAGKNARSTDVS